MNLISSKLVAIATLVTAICVSSNASVANVLLHSAEYTGEYKSFDIEFTRKIEFLGDERYRIYSKARFFLGYIEETEDFLWREADQIIPLNYRYKQKVFGIGRKRSIDFDWDDMKAKSNDDGDEKMLTLEPGMLGPMSYQLKLQVDLLQGKKEFDYQFVNRTRIKHYDFAVSGYEDIQYKDQVIKNAIKLTRENEGDDKTTTIWLTPDHRFTLASLEQKKEDDEHTIFLTASEYPQTRKDHPWSALVEKQNQKTIEK